MEDRHGRRRFGARLHSAPPPRPSGGPHHVSSQYNTPTFDQVASERSVSRPPPQRYHRGNWEDTHDSFHFDQEDDQDRPAKYQAARPKASGQSISVPGSSIVHASSVDEVLQKNFIPPKLQNDFLNSITRQNTMRNRGAGAKTKTMNAYAYASSSSSLEAASAPAPKKDVSKPPSGSSGWVDRRAAQTEPKPRARLASTDKRLKLEDERRKTQSSPYALRERRSSLLFEHSPTRKFSLRSARVAGVGKRKRTSEGSAAEPITLDSDSESDVEVKPDSAAKSMSIVDEVLTDSRKKAVKEDEEEKPPAVEPEDFTLNAVVQIHNCDVMIGLFQCIVDLFFQNDRMCMRNIRGKFDKWPFKSSYVLHFEHLQDVRLYSVPKEAESSTDIEVVESDRMEQLLGEASYLAFKLPLLEETDQDAVKTFYDPAGDDVLKAYMVLRPLEDATGGDLDDVRDILRGSADVLALDDKDQAKEHLQALVKDPFSYNAPRRSRRRKSTGENVDSSPPESDDDDADGLVTVLKYPLPPCTSDVITIIRKDVNRLKPKRYLNDNIVDYYFKRLMSKHFQDNEVVQERVLFLSSHFYSQLRTGKGPTARARLEAGYNNVSKWLSRSNFFNRSIIFIPINKDMHWSLAVIVNPGVAGTDPCGDEEAFSCVGVLDPLGSYHRKAAIVRNLRAVLRMEWENSRGRSSGDDPGPEYGVDRVLTLNVKAPLQENGYDCGVYVLKFAEVILNNCLELGLLAQNDGVISKDVTDGNLEAVITSSAFSAEDITATRKQIQQYIETDASKYEVLKKERGKAKALQQE
ncbi:hypothetical protein PF005_g16386 [Phytophthora fragariae]|uniref:Ubiquitin-like protease family profile domain-containing protein n=1 Tax=Phytophthora fragariae TaxID=53985 RepID=A0A6A3TGL0_9STRA|nr:hypothetical protein PF003_g9209 [Phytophthora fragariae]KAE8933002.1 hypothetical protein PF009_g16986 [Phytophthora fragariae]KAE8998097.1 hypothetical protein PF011_g15192 [Phytophthora fragariae]KAE9072568.1 hypothetical protein PF010_g25433 [Phytophthora fragariae]KAE9097139.1 hypothetical protein PF007_g16728 [Phytophthora fragariae]